MVSERDEMIEEIYELVHKNNKLLRAERRSRILGNVLHFVWMLIVVGVPVWLYFTYLQPMLENFQANIAQLEGISRNFPEIGQKINPIIETLKTLSDTFGVGGN